MKLTSARVFEFQSIRDSNPFEIGDITCLVGKNEAGKTALLRALYRLNPIISEDGEFDVTDDYPRGDVEDYQQDVESGRQKPAKVVELNFTLSEDEINSVEAEFGKGIVEKPTLTLSKGYDNQLYVRTYQNEQIAVKSVVDRGQLPADLADKLNKATTLQNLGELIKSEANAENQEHIDRLQEILEQFTEAKGLNLYIYGKYLKSKLPKLFYYDEYSMMKGSENIEALKSRRDQNLLEKPDYPLLGLIELARLNLDELLQPQRTEELVNKLEGAGNHLSKKVLQYWSQNKNLSMKFDVRPARPGDPTGMQKGTNIWGRVYDSKRQVSTPLGTRSRGFVWFFSFLAWFDQQQRKNEPLILLLDEPGLFLHGRAQADLLDYMEKELQGNHQVIYTTHSPFMVDAAKFERVRIVQDRSMDSDKKLPKDQDGTKVITEIFDATSDSLFPLQGALGYDIYQSLFVGPNCLVVEGVSDLLYIQTIASVLESQGRAKLDERWTITPVGGAEKVPTFVALLGAQKGLKIATLIDIHSGNTQDIENLYKRKLLIKQNVLTFASFTRAKEADIEDMFGDSFYLRLVNEEYAKELPAPITLKALDGKFPRILQKVEKHIEKNPLKTGYQFSHYRPARYFAENSTKLMPDISTETLDRFEEAFKALNALLKQS